MRNMLILVVLVLSAVACAGLAKDITKGANSTEREMNGRRTPVVDSEAGAPATSGTSSTPAD